jgi:hypothetical protein
VFTAVVRITGAGRLADFRERLRWLMVRDPDAEDFTEHHAAGRLEYRFAPKKGIPFPALAEASGDLPELRVEAEWEHDSVRGRAVIEKVGCRGAPVAAGGQDEIAVGDDGRLSSRWWWRSATTASATPRPRRTFFRSRRRVEPDRPRGSTRRAPGPGARLRRGVALVRREEAA